MSAILPGRLFVTAEAQPGFMHQRRRLQRMARRLPSHLLRRDPVRFLVDQAQEFFCCLLITAPNSLKQYRHVAHGLQIAGDLNWRELQTWAMQVARFNGYSPSFIAVKSLARNSCRSRSRRRGSPIPGKLVESR